MSQKEPNVQKEAISNFSLLYTPYPIFQTFFKHHNILSSDRLWSKLIKMLAFAGQCQITELFQSCLQLQGGSCLQFVNSKFTVMGLMLLLAITWVRLGKLANKQSTENQEAKVQTYLQLAPSSEEFNKEIEVAVRSQQKLRKEQAGRHLYSLILELCKNYGFSFEQKSSNDIFYIKSSEPLIFDSVELPSILQVNTSKGSTKSRLLMQIQEQPEKAESLTLQQYTNIIKYFDQLPIALQVMSLKRFLDVYCAQMTATLDQYNKKCVYYFTLNPKTILVSESNEKQELSFIFNQKYQEVFIYDRKKVPAGAEDSIYFCKSLFQTKSLVKADPWSAGLAILALIAPYESLKFFEEHFQKIDKRGLGIDFLKNQIQRLEENREVSTQNSIGALKKWLNLIQEPKQRMDNFNVVPISVPKKPVQKADLDWLNELLQKTTDQQKSSVNKSLQTTGISQSQTSRTSQQAKNIEFIRSITKNTNPPKPNPNNEIKSYTVYSTSSSTSYTRDVFSNKNKVVNYSNELKLDSFSKKGGGLEDAKWQKTVEKLNFIGNQYNRVYNIFGTKMSEEMIKLYKEKLYKNKNVYEEIGYQSKGPLMKTNGECPGCKKQASLITDYCSHSRCQSCYEGYMRQKFKQGNFHFLTCPQPKCNFVASQQLIEHVLQQKNKSQRELFLTELMKQQVTSNKDQLVRKCACSDKASYFQMSKNARMFLCDRCIKYKCSHCANQFHGSVQCEMQALKNGDLQLHLNRKLKELKQTKLLVQFKKEHQEQLLNRLKIKEISMIYELEATLTACVSQVWANKMKELGLFQKKSENSEMTEQVIDRMSQYLTYFYSKFTVIEFKTLSQIDKISQEMKPEVQKLLELHRLSGTILYVALT